jgi:hypothetical protein
MASLDIYVVVGHRVVVFLQVLETSPRRGSVAEILSSHYYVSFSGENLLERSRSILIVFLGVAGLPTPRRLATAPTRHGPASLTPPAPYTFDHYANAPDTEVENKMVRVKRDIWVSLHRTTLLNTSHSLDFS